MKRMVMSIALLGSSIMSAALPNTMHKAYQLNDVQSGQNNDQDAQSHSISEDEACDQEAVDAFDILMDDNADVPNEMIEAPAPVSPFEAYFKEIGVHMFMKYIAFKIWLEHHWQSLAK
jgi:hypothetical protein